MAQRFQVRFSRPNGKLTDPFPIDPEKVLQRYASNVAQESGGEAGYVQRNGDTLTVTVRYSSGGFSEISLVEVSE